MSLLQMVSAELDKHGDREAVTDVFPATDDVDANHSKGVTNLIRILPYGLRNVSYQRFIVPQYMAIH